MLWEIFAILAAAIWAVSNILDKYTLTKLVKTASMNELSLLIVVLFAILIAIFHGLPNLSIINLLLALFAGILEALAIFFYFYAAKFDEISRILPVFSFDTVFVAIIALLVINEVFSPLTYIGIGLLMVGITLISIKKLGRPMLNKAVFIMLFASFLLGSSTVMVKYLLGFSDYLSILTYVLLGYTFVLVPLLYVNFHKVKKLVKGNKKGVAVLVTKETISLFANILFIFAASIGPIALVNAFSSIQPLFVLIFAIGVSIFYPKILHEELKESSIIIKLVAIVVIIVGAYLISM